MGKAALVEHIADLDDDIRANWIDTMRDYKVAMLADGWCIWARRDQLPPPWHWNIWLMMAGRGFGKTRAGAEWVHWKARTPGVRIAIVGPTEDEARRVMIEGASGLLACGERSERPVWEPSRGQLNWTNGSTGYVYSGANAEGLRGPEHEFAWADEIAKWAQVDAAWSNLRFGLRRGRHPQVMVTTTPRPIGLLRRLVDAPGVAVTQGSTLDNRHNAASYIAAMTADYGGTRLGRQEIYGELIEDVEGALWTRDMIEACRTRDLPELVRVVVGVDPPAGTLSGSGGDACGIVVCGLGRDGVGYVIEDASVAGRSPQGWALAVAQAAARHGADRVVAEANNGGKMVETVLRAADSGLPVRLVHASRGKAARAEPVALLYAAGKVRHVGAFTYRAAPGMTDLAVQTSTYGAQIPKLFGRVRVAGTVIWATDLIETKKTQGGGKGRAATDTYSYSASFAVLLSARRIVRAERIWADGKLLRGSAGDLKVEVGALRVHEGGDDQMVDPLIASAEGSGASAWRGSAYAVFEGLQLADYGNRIPSLSFEVVADDAPVALGAMLAELAEGVSAEPGPLVVGFAATGTSVRGVVEAIRPAFPALCRDEGGAHIRFSPVAGLVLDPKNFGASASEARVPRMARDIAPLDTTAAALSVAYRDPARDYQAGLQRARREGPGLRDEGIDLPATVEASTAYDLATRALARRGIERRRASISLPWRAMALRPGDAVMVEGEDWRVAETRFERMTVQADLVRAETSLSATGVVDPGRNVAELDAIHGPTTLAVFDLPPLTDSVGATPAIGVFAAGTSPGWRRASLLASTDDGASFLAIGGTGLPAIIGATATLLAPGSTALIDRVNSVEVVLLNTGMTLADADTAALLAGANRAMVGGEMIQFGRAQPVSAGRWRLSELWRGRRGTEDAVVPHSAGAAFVLIEEAAVAPVPLGQAVAGVRVMAAGIGDSDPYPEVTCATAARAVMPLAPVHPTVTALSSGDTLIAWTRRSRAGWGWRDGIEVPLGEEREAYGVVWSGGSAETVSPDFTYTTIMRAADIASGATTATFTIRQFGDAALSPPLLITFTL